MGDEKLEKLKQQRDQLNARIAKENARQRAANRKDDTRRKILLGSLCEKMITEGQWPEEKVKEALDDFLTRPHDRALFGLDIEDQKPDL